MSVFGLVALVLCRLMRLMRLMQTKTLINDPICRVQYRVYFSRCHDVFWRLRLEEEKYKGRRMTLRGKVPTVKQPRREERSGNHPLQAKHKQNIHNALHQTQPIVDRNQQDPAQRLVPSEASIYPLPWPGPHRFKMRSRSRGIAIA